MLFLSPQLSARVICDSVIIFLLLSTIAIEDICSTYDRYSDPIQIRCTGRIQLDGQGGVVGNPWGCVIRPPNVTCICQGFNARSHTVNVY